MNNFKILLYLVIGLVLACTENDDETIEITVSIADFETSINENPESGLLLGTAEATTNEGSLAYSIAEQSLSDAIAINTATGEITVLTESLFDYEVNPTITAIVIAENGAISDTANITISLNDINETTVSIADFETSINENPESGLSLGNVEAVTNEGSITYSITEQSPSDAIAINTATGEITVLTESLFDYEVNPTITAIVIAENGAISDTANITISLNDINETTVSIADFETSINENPESGLSLGNVEAVTNEGSITYSITEQSPSDAIAINTATGEITVLTESLFDYEVNPTITAIVKAVNGAIYDMANITISLNDINETTVSIADFETSINENPESGLSLGTVEATTNEGSLTYSITEQSPSDAIAINTTTGEVTVLTESLFDYEVNPSITAIVKAENGAISDTANITINLKVQSLQERLDTGETPCEIYQSDNSLLENLYGLSYQGGLLFYLNTNDCTGMIAAPNDQSINAEWGCNGLNIIDAVFSGIGYGLSNTNAIISTCNESNYAAKICSELVLDSYNDWYLPSKDELNLIHTNLFLNGMGGFIEYSYSPATECCGYYGWYWSSTEFEDATFGYDGVWVQLFDSDRIETETETQTVYDIGIKSFGKNRVRAVRSF